MSNSSSTTTNTTPTNKAPLQFKVCLIGAGKTGKSAFVHRHLGGAHPGDRLAGSNQPSFEERYTPTLGVEVHPLEFRLSSGEEVVLNVWDTAGQEKFAGLRDGYYLAADAAIFFHGPGIDEEMAKRNLEDFHRLCPTAPIAHVWSKWDIAPGADTEREEDFKALLATLPPGETLSPISAKEGWYLREPFRDLIRRLLGRESTIQFLDERTSGSQSTTQPAAVVTMETVHQYLTHGVPIPST